MAAFHSIIYGRFWVITKAMPLSARSKRFPSDAPRSRRKKQNDISGHRLEVEEMFHWTFAARSSMWTNNPHLGQVVSVLKTGLRGDCDFVKRASKAGRENDRAWKAWKAKKPAFHPSHTPWKSLRDYHIPTASAAGIFQSTRA
jgi:hypothetical protein